MERERDILESLESLAKSEAYPFHMPGHKRNADFLKKYGIFPKGFTPYDIDITEIDGFDDLHDACGIIKRAEDLAAGLFGAEKAVFSVNGSTGGLLAAIGASCKRGDGIIVARNCHKAVYHAIELFGLSPVYIMPETVTESGIFGSITPESVRDAFNRAHKAGLNKISALVLTSPTYEGVVSDIASIAEEAHRQGVVCIVDEAHGAHFGILRGEADNVFFPENAMRLGADIAVASYHKTLPCYTQTAVTYISTKGVKAGLYERIREEFDILETSSPSYILMAGMERAIEVLCHDGVNLMSAYRKRLINFTTEAGDLKNIRVNSFIKNAGVFDFDPGKLVIEVPYGKGADIYERLQCDYGLILEMRSEGYALAMTSLCDTDEGFERLNKALHELDSRYESKSQGKKVFKALPKMKLLPWEAAELVRKEGKRKVPYPEAVGKVAAGYVYFYPPGIPVLVPGELIDEAVTERIKKAVDAGITVKGGDSYGTYICNDGKECNR